MTSTRFAPDFVAWLRVFFAVAGAAVLLTATAASADTVEATALAVARRQVETLSQTGPPLTELDVAVVVWADLGDAPNAAGLVELWEHTVAQELRPLARRVESVHRPANPQAAAAFAAREAFDVLLETTLHVDGPYLNAEAHVVRAGRGTFRDLFQPQPEISSRFVVRTRLDARLRHFVGPAPRWTGEAIETRTVTLPSRGYLAVATSDLDRDEEPEVVLLRRDRVEVFRLVPEGPALELIERLPLSDLPRAPARSRRPLGVLTRSNDALVGRTSDHSKPFVLASDGQRLRVTASDICPAVGYPLRDSCAQRVAGRDYFHGTLLPRHSEAERRTAASGFYRRLHRDVLQPDGSLVTMEVLVTPRGRLAARAGDVDSGAAGFGAALGAADLDQDGVLEILVTDAGPASTGDRLSVLRLTAAGALRTVWAGDPLAGAVTAVGAGDADGDGLVEWLVVEEPTDGRAAATLRVMR